MSDEHDPEVTPLPADPKSKAAEELQAAYREKLLSRAREAGRVVERLERARLRVQMLRTRLAGAERELADLGEKVARRSERIEARAEFSCPRCFRAYPAWADRGPGLRCVCGAVAELTTAPAQRSPGVTPPMELRAPSYPHFYLLLEDQTRKARLQVVCTLRPLGWYLTSEVPAEWLGRYKMKDGVAVAFDFDLQADAALLKAAVDSVSGAPLKLSGAWEQVELRWRETGFLSSRRVTSRLLSRVPRPDWGAW